MSVRNPRLTRSSIYDGDCPHVYSDRRACPHCAVADRERAREEPSGWTPRPVRARYGGTCSRCHSDYPAQTMLVRHGGGWAHAADCTPDTEGTS